MYSVNITQNHYCLALKLLLILVKYFEYINFICVWLPQDHILQEPFPKDLSWYSRCVRGDEDESKHLPRRSWRFETLWNVNSNTKVRGLIKRKIVMG